MSAKVPGFSSYQTTPFTLAITTAPSSFGSLTGGWTMEMGSTAILCIQMPADTQQIAICKNGFSGTTASCLVDDTLRPHLFVLKQFNGFELLKLQLKQLPVR
jgi:hypothetical protein